MHLLFNVRCAKESYRSPFTLNCCTWHLLLSLGCPSSSRAHDIMRQEKMYLDGHCLGVEVSHKLVQGSKVLLNLLCKVPARRLILLHGITRMPQPGARVQGQLRSNSNRAAALQTQCMPAPCTVTAPYLACRCMMPIRDRLRPK